MKLLDIFKGKTPRKEKDIEPELENYSGMFKKGIILFILGAACFIISQPLLRLPLLNYIQKTTRFNLLYALNPLLIGIIIAFSAGVFEEGFRFIFKNFLLKEVKFGILEPIIFGFGHGLAEALIFLLPALSLVSFTSLYLAIFERFLAIILHIGLTVIIWNGFQLSKKYKYLGIAILVHGLVNSMIPIFGFAKNRILIIESLLALVSIFIVMYIYKSKKYYKFEGEKNEKI